ncbi:hypothetical protein [Mycoplasma zalophi]|nr:hypothetical protein [Mycoplasma zalophi]
MNRPEETWTNNNINKFLANLFQEEGGFEESLNNLSIYVDK